MQDFSSRHCRKKARIVTMRRSLQVCRSCKFLKKKLGKYECQKDGGWVNGMLEAAHYQALVVGCDCVNFFEHQVMLQSEFSTVRKGR